MTEFGRTLDSAMVLGSPTWDRPADRLRSAAEARYDTIRNSAGLTPEATQSLLAQVYLRLVADMQALESRSNVAAVQDAAAIKRRLFGIDDLVGRANPADAATMAVSFRDAQDRAQQIQNEAQAQELLDRANETGDELLARAVGNYCLSDGGFGPTYAGVGDAYLADRPDKAAAYAELQDARQPLDVATMWEFVVPQPLELNGLNSSQITLLASNAEQIRSSFAATQLGN